MPNIDAETRVIPASVKNTNLTCSTIRNVLCSIVLHEAREETKSLTGMVLGKKLTGQ